MSHARKVRSTALGALAGLYQYYGQNQTMTSITVFSCLSGV